MLRDDQSDEYWEHRAHDRYGAPVVLRGLTPAVKAGLIVAAGASLMVASLLMAFMDNH